MALELEYGYATQVCSLQLGFLHQSKGVHQQRVLVPTYTWF